MGTVASAAKSNRKWIAGITSASVGAVAIMYSSSESVRAESAESVADRIAKNIEVSDDGLHS